MPSKPQVFVRIAPEKLAKLDRLAVAFGMRRGTLLRQILEEFSDTADQLADLVGEARKGMGADALEAWAVELVQQAARDVDQLQLPVKRGDARS